MDYGMMPEYIFNNLSRCWENDASYNLAFLTDRQNWFNTLLRIRENHTVTVKEVLEDLGFSRDDVESRFESKVGWHDDGSGSTIIDLGIFRECNNDFIKGGTPIAKLRFNNNMMDMSLLTDEIAEEEQEILAARKGEE